MTLVGCASPGEFFLKRVARLVPSMVVCSLTTYATLDLLPGLFRVSPRDFIASWSFIDPDILERVFHAPFGAVDGVYWSLFVEVKFYFWAALLYFAVSRGRFVVRFFVFANLVLGLMLLSLFAPLHVLTGPVELLVFPRYLAWFAAGVGYFNLWENHADRLSQMLIAESFLVVAAQSVAAGKTGELVFSAAFFAAFLVFVYRPQWLRVLAWRPLAVVGASSYSLYLLHQEIGVTVIAKLAELFGLTGRPLSVVLAPLVAALIALVAVVLYRSWEIPSKRFIVRLQKRDQTSASPSSS